MVAACPSIPSRIIKNLLRQAILHVFGSSGLIATG
jgi:hypothetical protein